MGVGMASDPSAGADFGSQELATHYVKGLFVCVLKEDYSKSTRKVYKNCWIIKLGKGVVILG